MVHSVKSCWHSIDWLKKNSPWKWSLSPHSMLNDSLKWLARSNCKHVAKTVQTWSGSRSSSLWKIWSALWWKTWREAISSSTLRKGNSNQFPSKCQSTSCPKYAKPSNTYINTGLSIEISNWKTLCSLIIPWNARRSWPTSVLPRPSIRAEISKDRKLVLLATQHLRSQKAARMAPLATCGPLASFSTPC